MNKLERKDRNIIAGLGLIFLFLAYKVYGTDYGVLFDNYILEKLHRQTNTSLLSLSKFISFLGSAYIIVVLVLALLIYFIRKKNYYLVKLLLANSVLSYLINFILKAIIHRVRPLDFFRIDYFGYSFPSGHSMINMSLYLTLAHIITRNQDNKKTIYILASLYIAGMGFSRLYLGVHWPTDVLGGYIMGYIIYKLTREKYKEISFI